MWVTRFIVFEVEEQSDLRSNDRGVQNDILYFCEPLEGVSYIRSTPHWFPRFHSRIRGNIPLHPDRVQSISGLEGRRESFRNTPVASR